MRCLLQYAVGLPKSGVLFETEVRVDAALDGVQSGGATNKKAPSSLRGKLSDSSTAWARFTSIGQSSLAMAIDK